MLKIIVIVLVVAIAALLIYAAFQPDHFAVERSVSITAPPEKIFPLVNNLHRFNEWNPFNKKDPDIKSTYSGADAGKGAKYAFDGNNNVGKGNIEIIEVTEPTLVAMKLNMTAPLRASNDVKFTINSAGPETRVTWSMQGESPYFAKVMHVFFSMDKMVGGEFEAGLSSLKGLAERA
jgi:uncharacterized protein YndB with AHSA1/START domain